MLVPLPPLPPPEIEVHACGLKVGDMVRIWSGRHGRKFCGVESEVKKMSSSGEVVVETMTSVKQTCSRMCWNLVVESAKRWVLDEVENLEGNAESVKLRRHLELNMRMFTTYMPEWWVKAGVEDPMLEYSRLENMQFVHASLLESIDEAHMWSSGFSFWSKHLVEPSADVPPAQTARRPCVACLEILGAACVLRTNFNVMVTWALGATSWSHIVGLKLASQFLKLSLEPRHTTLQGVS
jgi:hypothetical protein